MKILSINKILVITVIVFSFRSSIAQSIVYTNQFCDYEALLANQTDQEKNRREDLYLQLIGVLETLSKYRKEFISNKKFIDLFPTVYYHITSLEMEKIRNGNYMFPKWKMNQMLTFYDAYAYNRLKWDSNHVNEVEPHWINHFTIAKNNNVVDINFPCINALKVKETLESAIEAHIDYDLQNSIRYTFENRINSLVQQSDLYPEFMAVNQLFDDAQLYALEDIKFLSSFACHAIISAGSYFSNLDILSRREAAWNNAFSSNIQIQYNGYTLKEHLYDSMYRKQYKLIGESVCKNTSNYTLFLIDRSGSMQKKGISGERKIDEAKNAAIYSLQSLQNNQTISQKAGFLTFSGSCVPDPTANQSLNFSSNVQNIQNSILAIPNPFGGTPLLEAIDAATERLQNYLINNGSNKTSKLIILSDGLSSCKKVRPKGVYAKGVDMNKTTNKPLVEIKYYTIGFDILPGSNAERDLQYLAQKTGGKYLNAKNNVELTRAFQRFFKVYNPKKSAALDNLEKEDEQKFIDGLSKIAEEDYSSANSLFEELYKLYENDAHIVFNLALMNEANDFHDQAIALFEKYLSLKPKAKDREWVLKQIELLKKDKEMFFEYTMRILKNDLEYLNLHFQKIQNGESLHLAEEFKGFIEEKIDYYTNLPKALNINKKTKKITCKEIARGLRKCSKLIKKEPANWDKNASSFLSQIYLSMERLIASF